MPDDNGGKRNLAEQINEYRNLLWAAVFIIMLGSYAFNGLTLIYLAKGQNDNVLAIQILDRDIRAVREKQIAVVGDAVSIHRQIQEQVADLKERVQKMKQ